ncbi:hypothetical protein FRB99_008197 [Tulasnella sp. 403]|nr:hypothetical protein FRB99_008197 [Tulasnella sp. 403]
MATFSIPFLIEDKLYHTLATPVTKDVILQLNQVQAQVKCLNPTNTEKMIKDWKPIKVILKSMAKQWQKLVTAAGWPSRDKVLAGAKDKMYYMMGDMDTMLNHVIVQDNAFQAADKAKINKHILALMDAAKRDTDLAEDTPMTGLNINEDVKTSTHTTSPNFPYYLTSIQTVDQLLKSGHQFNVNLSVKVNKHKCAIAKGKAKQTPIALELAQAITNDSDGEYVDIDMDEEDDYDDPNQGDVMSPPLPLQQQKEKGKGKAVTIGSIPLIHLFITMSLFMTLTYPFSSIAKGKKAPPPPPPSIPQPAEDYEMCPTTPLNRPPPSSSIISDSPTTPHVITHSKGSKSTKGAKGLK